MTTHHPTQDEQQQFKISSFKGIEVGLGQADPVASISAKLEEQYPNHLILVQAGVVLVIVWHALAIPRTFVYSSLKCLKPRITSGMSPRQSVAFFTPIAFYGRGAAEIKDPKSLIHASSSISLMGNTANWACYQVSTLAPTPSFETGIVGSFQSQQGATMSNSVFASIEATQSLVSIQNGKPATTSNIIAAIFGKRHTNVLRAIRTLECSPEFNALNFEPIKIDVNLGYGRIRQDTAYAITKDGFMFLAMGFTGKEAAKWKEQFIQAFNTKESELLRISNESRPYSATPPGDIEDKSYYRECRNELFKFMDSLPEGTKWVQDEETRQRIADGFLTDILCSRRWLVSFGDGGVQMKPVDKNVCLIDPASSSNLHTLINEFIPLTLLPKVIDSANCRIAKNLNRLVAA